MVKPRGFCAGVNRAIKTVEQALSIFGSPVYVYHQIVHNNYVVEALEEKGAVFVEDLSDVPNNEVIIFSAHGIPPYVLDEAKKRNLKTIDATCPLVTKVHMEAIYFEKNDYKIILIGHKEHQEVVGTMGYAEMTLVEHVDDVEKLEISTDVKKIVYLTQTTLSMDNTADIVDKLKNKYPNIKSAPKGDICYASQNRQNAIKDLGEHADVVLVVGAMNSSNSVRLVETAKKKGKPAFLIPDLDNIDDRNLKNYKIIGITSGASVPEILVERLVSHIKEISPNVEIQDINVIEENTIFPLPKELNK